jgi:hypothetical protein
MTRRTIGQHAIALALLTLFSLPQGAAAIGTAFTYQGQLQQSGSPGTGPCDFRFMLFDTAGNGSPPTGGNQIGNLAAADGVQVSNGLFTLPLDFGAAAFNTGSDRWLQIAVRCPAGSGSYQTLAPRQPLTPAPFALFASAVADGSVSSAKLAPGAVMTSQLAANAVTAAQIADGTITANDLANGAVSTAKIGDGQVTSAKLVAPLRLTSSVANTKIGAFDGTSTGLNGVGVSGTASSGIGSAGVFGVANTGAGVQGESISGDGVQGESDNGTGVQGAGKEFGVRGSSGDGDGVFGLSAKSTGAGVHGVADTDAAAKGVFGESDEGSGVVGESRQGDGVRGTSRGGTGVYGEGVGHPGVWGESDDDGVFGVSTGSGDGVSGVAMQGAGVHGESIDGAGVLGEGKTFGVHGIATGAPARNVLGGAGVVGEGEKGGVFGIGRVGVAGVTDVPNGNGVYGTSLAANDTSAVGVRGEAQQGIGVRGESTSGFAGYFVGPVFVGGNLIVNGVVSAGGKLFKIDHPLDPANKYLMHAAVESSDMKNLYDGVVVLDTNGEARVDLPEWFEALNRDFRYQLTCIGGVAAVYVADEVNESHFRIAGGTPGLKVSWQVTGIRKDAFAVAHPLVVEPEKSADERGRYLYPAALGMPASLSVDRAQQFAIH